MGRDNPSHFYFRPRGHDCHGREFPLYHTVRILSIRKLHKHPAAFSPEFVQHYQLTFGAVCGILMVSRGDREHLFQVGLGTMCGGREKSAETLGKSQSSKKNVKNPLTNRPSCDTIRVSRGESAWYAPLEIRPLKKIYKTS